MGEGTLHALRGEIEAQKESNLGYNVVFQRAYFLACRDWFMVDEAHLEDLEVSDAEDVFEEGAEEDDEYGDQEVEEADAAQGDDAGVDEGADSLAAHLRQRAQEFVHCLNIVVERAPNILQPDCFFDDDEETGGRRFWLGTLVTAEGVIDFTQGASLRAREVIFWAVAMQMYDQRVSPNERSDFGEFWTDVLDSDISYLKRIRRSIVRFADKEGSAGGRILKARGDDFDRDASREEARARMRWLWTVLEL